MSHQALGFGGFGANGACMASFVAIVLDAFLVLGLQNGRKR